MERPIPTIPTSIAELTPVWLTWALRSGGVLASGTITDREVQVIGEDRGFTGVVARVHLKGVDIGTAPTTLIAKLPNASRAQESAYMLSQRQGATLTQQANERAMREVAFYREIAEVADTPAPSAYFVASDPDRGESVLLLQDLAGGRDGDALAGCSIEDARGVLRAIARFHARWWGRGDRADRAWLPTFGGDPQARTARYRQYYPTFLQRFGARLTPDARHLVVALADVFGEVTARSAAGPTTIIHADLHLDNIIFTDEDYVQPVAILDWQTVARGPAAYDVSVFLAGALEPSSRRSAESRLLQEYHALLVEHGVAGYGFDEFVDDYRAALLRHIGGVVIWQAVVDLDALDGRERALVDAVVNDGWLFDAALDHDLSGLISAG